MAAHHPKADISPNDATRRQRVTQRQQILIPEPIVTAKDQGCNSAGTIHTADSTMITAISEMAST